MKEEKRLVDFCDKRKLVVANILFQNHERRRSLWMMQGDKVDIRLIMS
jgi:hypothetical protein